MTTYACNACLPCSGKYQLVMATEMHFCQSTMQSFVTPWFVIKREYAHCTVHSVSDAIVFKSRRTFAVYPVDTAVVTDSDGKLYWLEMYLVCLNAHVFVLILMSLCTANIYAMQRRMRRKENMKKNNVVSGMNAVMSITKVLAMIGMQWLSWNKHATFLITFKMNVCSSANVFFYFVPFSVAASASLSTSDGGSFSPFFHRPGTRALASRLGYVLDNCT